MTCPVLLACLLSAVVPTADSWRDTFPMDRGLVDISVCDGGYATLRFSSAGGVTSTIILARAFRSPQVSPGGRFLAYLSGDSLYVVDWRGVRSAAYAGGYPYAVGPHGDVAVARGASLVLLGPHLVPTDIVLLPSLIVGVARDTLGTLLAATSSAVYRLDGAVRHNLFTPGDEGRVIWLGNEGDTPRFLVRSADHRHEWITHGLWDGTAIRVVRRYRVPSPPRRQGIRDVPWPFLPDTLPPLGNSYGEYQNYGGTAYRHPGVDLMGRHYEPVYAVADGVVKAVLTTSGSYHWRVAIGDAPGPGQSEGWLYAHLDLPTIAVTVGDAVEKGEYIGSLVPWPVADFTHLHFARIAEAGETWSGQWLAIGNPGLMAGDVAEGDAPFFLDVNGALLAFCGDNTSTYLPPDSLAGLVDIIAHVGDRVKSPWVVCAQEITWHVYPQGRPSFPVIDNQLSVYFDHAIDVYQGGTEDQVLVPVLWKHDSVCPTAGNYDEREFYHIITNSDGDSIPEVSDEQGSFNTTILPDGPYVVRVAARDLAGNHARDSLTVILRNGNPPLNLQADRRGHDLLLTWPSMSGASAYFVYQVPGPHHPGSGRLLAAVEDTCFLVREAFLTGTEGYYRVVASDVSDRPGGVRSPSNPAIP